VASPRRRAFPLLPRQRMTGVAYGTQRSVRRGQGAEIAGARPYRPGDRLAWIDWYASARQSLVQGEDVFVVREYYAELAPRVIILADRRPSMALYPPDLPWLAKQDVLREATTAIVAAGHAARAYVGYLDFSRGGPGHGDVVPHWLAPHRQNDRLISRRLGEKFDAPTNSLELAIDYLLSLRRDVPAGSFVFVISDFLRPPAAQLWSRARARGWDLVPVIVQDPVWEQSFPAVQGLLVPVTDPEDGTTASVRLSGREADERRRSNEARLRDLILGFQRLQFDPVLLDTSDPATIDLKFINWATRRRLTRGPKQ
jgi:uncharacterized protein (DUF58 family)